MVELGPIYQHFTLYTVSCFQKTSYIWCAFNKFYHICIHYFYIIYLLVPVGSIPELPAESCKEIKASEGRQAVSGKYWFDSLQPGKVILAHCDMEMEGETPYLNQFFFNVLNNFFAAI